MTSDGRCSATVTGPLTIGSFWPYRDHDEACAGSSLRAVLVVYQRVCRCRHEATSPSAACACLLVRDRYDSRVRGQRVGAAQGGCLSALRFRAVRSRNGALLSAGNPGEFDLCGCEADRIPPSAETTTLHVPRTSEAPA